MSDFYGMSRKRMFGEGMFWLAIALGTIVVLTVVGLAWRYIIASPRGKVQAQEQIQSGANRIAQYDLFFNRCATVQSDEAAIVALREELTTNPSDSRRGQIFASIAALKAGRAEQINQYNADARKSYTAGQFRSSQLPYQLDLTAKETSCVA